jgi:two-component system chemotaxis sensor kinase CheA
MTDQEVYGLIFAPGFSTAEVVTDVSGRGVGMDVVKKNITALGGTVEIDSAEGYGMTVRVRLPLTLAIMDGMSVGVGEECYILPLSSVVESFQVQPGVIKTIGGSGRVVRCATSTCPWWTWNASSTCRASTSTRQPTSWSWSKPKAAAWPCWWTNCWASSRWW